MSAPTRLIQTAIYGVLSADSALAALVTGIYNDVPDNAVFPYLLMAEARGTKKRTMGGGGKGWEVFVPLYASSRYQGDLQALQLLERVEDLLDEQPLTVTGYSTVIVDLARQRVEVKNIKKVETRYVMDEFCVYVHQ